MILANRAQQALLEKLERRVRQARQDLLAASVQQGPPDQLAQLERLVQLAHREKQALLDRLEA